MSISRKKLDEEKRNQLVAEMRKEELSWFSVNWRIPLFELDYSNGGIYHAKKT